MTAIPARPPGIVVPHLRLIIPALTLLATSSVLLAWTLENSARPTTAVVWGGLALATLAFALLCLSGGALHNDLGLGRWKIGSLMLVGYALAYGFASVTWSEPQAGVAAEIDLSSVLQALWLVGGGDHSLGSRLPERAWPGCPASPWPGVAGTQSTLRRSGARCRSAVDPVQHRQRGPL